MNSSQSCKNIGLIKILPEKSKIKKLINNYSFYFFNEIVDFEEDIITKFKSSKVAIINFYGNEKEHFFIIGLNQMIIVVNENVISSFQLIFSEFSELRIYFIDNSKNIFNQHMKIPNQQDEFDNIFIEEFYNFNSIFKINKIIGFTYDKMNKSIQTCITAYLIKESYIKLSEVPKINFSMNLEQDCETNNNTRNILCKEEDFVFLRIIDITRSNIDLIYHIDSKSLFVKKFLHGDDNKEESIYREYKNYLNLNFPLIPKLIYLNESLNYIVIEYINGKTLLDISEFHFSIEDKVAIIYQIMLIIEYLHKNKFIYRDLKPDNIMIDDNKTVHLIDFDRMITESESLKENQEHTKDFRSNFVAPEVNNGDISYKNDIYSIGKIMYYIINEQEIEIENLNDEKIDQFNKFKDFQSIYENCTKENANERPSISDLIFLFYLAFSSQLNDSFIHSEPRIKYFNGILNNDDEYIKLNITKTIYYLSLASNKNNPIAQDVLGKIYLSGKYIKQDINKALIYISAAANQNIPSAQYNLGIAYYEGKYLTKDIDKAIHYLKLSADQNISNALTILGVFYLEGRYLKKDINKALNYFFKAADLNNGDALNNLGTLYIKGKYVEKDINKGIQYYFLAAEQRNPNAQNSLGGLYYDGIYLKRDVNKAINYLTLSANQNNIQASYNLGLIFFEGKYVKKDIEKSIHYFTIAADQNNLHAQNYLGFIYYSVKNKRDLEKSIHYFSLAADQNDPNAQYVLGCIYNDNIFIKRNINLAIYYFTLAANQNHADAANTLANIYFYSHNYDNAIHYLKIAANQNIPEAQMKLGGIYHEGIYTKRDIKKTIYYLTLAANQNNPIAQNNLAVIYCDGKYIKRDINKAIYYLTLAANQNFVNAQYNIGGLYYEGVFIKRDINKAIYYFTLAANQNHTESQLFLGKLYYEGEYTKQNINKAIQYFSSAAKQNHPLAQFMLGLFYYKNEFTKRDIQKAIYYFSLAAKQNEINSQKNLSMIYYEGKYITRDIPKSIYYLQMAAEQNDSNALYNLGVFYSNGKYINRDINKSISYSLRAAQQGDSMALTNLGLLYLEGKYVKQNIYKAIDYFVQAANRNYSVAQNNLGTIFLIGEFVTRDINKAIHFYTLAANQNNPYSQYSLGCIFTLGLFIEKNFIKGIDYFMQSSKNGYKVAHFYVAYFYHEGKHIKRDIDKSIHFYKEASSMYDFYAKNNLGIIYKNGFGKINKNIGFAIEYFEDAIKKNNDIVSMYNLAHLYIYEDQTKERINEAIKLLIKALDKNLLKSKLLLCIALIKKHGFNLGNIKYDINNQTEKSSNLPFIICQIIINRQLYIESVYKKEYQYLSTIDYLYDFRKIPIPSKYINMNKISKPDNNKYNITQEFYDGFRNDLYP